MANYGLTSTIFIEYKPYISLNDFFSTDFMLHAAEAKGGTMKFIDEIDIHAKKVLFRFDFNVPLDSSRNIADDTQIGRFFPRSIMHSMNTPG